MKISTYARIASSIPSVVNMAHVFALDCSDYLASVLVARDECPYQQKHRVGTGLRDYRSIMLILGFISYFQWVGDLANSLEFATDANIEYIM